MEIKYGANCGVTVKRFVPCAIVRVGDDIQIDEAHPHAKELTEIAVDLMNNVKLLDADDWKGEKLLDRVEELAGKEASDELMFAWSDFLKRQRKAAAERKARRWVAKWAATALDERVEADADADADLLNALCVAGNKALPHAAVGGLSAVFAYGYQQGRDDAAKRPGKAVTV